jgi:hypothetical protein
LGRPCIARRLRLARQPRAAPQQAREASPDKASTQSLEEDVRSACLLQTEFRRPRLLWLELRPPRRYLTGKPHFRFASYCFGQMRPKRRHGRFGAMRVTPAVGPLAIKIVRMVGDPGHSPPPHHSLYLQCPRANRISAGDELNAQFNFAACAGDVIAQLGELNAPRDVTAFRQRRPYARRAQREEQPQ